MIGNNSFNIIESEIQIKGSYYPEIMKKWKAIVGFSGTIVDSTLN
jgi:hypothetical protein